MSNHVKYGYRYIKKVTNIFFCHMCCEYGCMFATLSLWSEEVKLQCCQLYITVVEQVVAHFLFIHAIAVFIVFAL